MLAMHDVHEAPDQQKPTREPIFKVPFVPFVVAAGLMVLYYAQRTMPDDGLSLGLRPYDLENGYWTGLFTYMTVHGSLVHVGMNALGIVAFGTPLARDLTRGLGSVAWLLFFIICGVLSAIGYSLVYPGDMVWLVGASGALFGLIGASSRLLPGAGIILPLTHPFVLKNAAVWLAVTALLGVFGGALGGDGARVAWVVHIFGYVAGIVLVAPFHHFFGAKHPDLAEPGNNL